MPDKLLVLDAQEHQSPSLSHPLHFGKDLLRQFQDRQIGMEDL